MFSGGAMSGPPMGAGQQQLYMPQPSASSAFAGLPYGCGCGASTCGTAVAAQPGHDGRGCYNSLPERMDFGQSSLPMLLHSGGGADGACVHALDASAPQLAGSLHNSSLLAAGLGHPQLANSVTRHLTGGIAQQLGASGASPLSMLYAGATALGPGAAAIQANSNGNVDVSNEPQQKRRFVWTPDLHARFEAACNILGLDNAKPKSILRLMNVEGLTKANIKSHLQKYRCMVQKRDSVTTATDPNDNDDEDNDADPGEMTMPATDAATADADRVICGNAGEGNHQVAQTGSSGAVCLDDKRLLAEGETSMQRNLELQAENLMAQMELQEQLSRQLTIQKRLEAELEVIVHSPSAGENASSSSAKFSEILALKNKLQSELQAHLRMQHEQLLQLNQVMLPAISGDVDAPSENAQSTVESSDAEAGGAAEEQAQQKVNGFEADPNACNMAQEAAPATCEAAVLNEGSVAVALSEEGPVVLENDTAGGGPVASAAPKTVLETRDDTDGHEDAGDAADGEVAEGHATVHADPADEGSKIDVEQPAKRLRAE